MIVTADSLLPRSVDRFSFDSYPEVYRNALTMVWEGRTREALTEVADCLAEEPDHGLRFPLYRLWIELLSEDQDHGSLKMLARHLRLRSVESQGGDKIAFTALYGLAHFELDDFDTAKVVARSVKDQSQDSYAMELNHLVALRTKGHATFLLRSTEGLFDYFHWVRLAQVSKIEDQGPFMSEVLQTVGRVFPVSPLPLLYTFHDSLDQEDFDTAADCARQLCARYPQHAEYQFFHGFSLLRAGKPGFALQALEQATGLMDGDDPEIIFAMGECHHRMAQTRDAVSYYKRAQKLFMEMGLPTFQVDAKLSEIAAGEKDERGEVMRQARLWLVCLSPRRYHEMQHKSDHELARVYRPMGSEPMPGDLCFFASLPAPDLVDGPARICAIFSVDSAPQYDPGRHLVTALQLVAKPQGGIPIDMRMLDDDKESPQQDLSKDHPFYHGVYELELGALDLITEAIKRRNDERDETSDLAEELLKLRRPG